MPNSEPTRMIVYPKHNNQGKKDADYFALGGKLYSQFKRETEPQTPPPDIFVFNNLDSKAKQSTSLLKAMEERVYTHYIFFCHGFKTGIQPGIYSPKWRGFDKRAEAIWEGFTTLIARVPNPRVVLYCCLTGSDPEAPISVVGDDSFGDLLRDELSYKNALSSFVVSHTTSGDSWRNPNKRIFEGDGNPYGQVGGDDLAVPGTPEFRRLRTKLADDGQDEIRKRLPVSRANCLAWKIIDLPKAVIRSLV